MDISKRLSSGWKRFFWERFLPDLELLKIPSGIAKFRIQGISSTVPSWWTKTWVKYAAMKEIISVKVVNSQNDAHLDAIFGGLFLFRPQLSKFV